MKCVSNSGVSNTELDIVSLPSYMEMSTRANFVNVTPQFYIHKIDTVADEAPFRLQSVVIDYFASVMIYYRSQSLGKS